MSYGRTEDTLGCRIPYLPANEWPTLMLRPRAKFFLGFNYAGYPHWALLSDDLTTDNSEKLESSLICTNRGQEIIGMPEP